MMTDQVMGPGCHRAQSGVPLLLQLSEEAAAFGGLGFDELMDLVVLTWSDTPRHPHF